MRLPNACGARAAALRPQALTRLVVAELERPPSVEKRGAVGFVDAQCEAVNDAPALVLGSNGGAAAVVVWHGSIAASCVLRRALCE